jgi:hypothetical protein
VSCPKTNHPSTIPQVVILVTGEYGFKITSHGQIQNGEKVPIQAIFESEVPTQKAA